MILVFIAACSRGPDVPPPATSTTEPTPTEDTGTPTHTTPVELPPNISEVLGDCDGAFREPDEYPNQILPGDDLHELDLTDPTAICDDGTPAALYVRAATDPAHAGDWVLHLQGGSECTTADECEIRWCGSDYYDASKMSSSWTPPTIKGPGIHATDDPNNQFIGWNHVFFYYCSSDNWIGQSPAVLTATDGKQFTVERRGHQILASALALLSAGATSDDATQVMPGLLTASTVYFTGTSAGSIAAQASLDWVRELLPPSIDVLGVFDAAISPDPSTVAPDVLATVDEGYAERYADRLAAELTPPFLDESCAATVAPADAWQCQASSHLPYLFVSTPFLARMDQEDPATGAIYLQYGATPDDFSASVLGSMNLLSAKTTVVSAKCGDHLGLETTATFLYESVQTAQGPITLHDAMLAFLAGSNATAIDEDGTASVCGPDQ